MMCAQWDSSCNNTRYLGEGPNLGTADVKQLLTGTAVCKLHQVI